MTAGTVRNTSAIGRLSTNSGHEREVVGYPAERHIASRQPRGVPRVDDRRVLNGIFWVLRTGAPWRVLPKKFGPSTTCYNRFVRWRKAGVD
jgi:transposase